MRYRNTTVLGAAFAATVTGSLAADVILVTTDNAMSSNSTSYGIASGSLSWMSVGGGNYSLTLTLTNESTVGGFLTAIAFDAPSSAGSSGFVFENAPGSGLSNAWDNLSSVNTAPFGSRDYGASVTNQWLGGGAPTSGLAAGDTGIWTWSGFVGNDHLTGADFIADQNFLLRFRGFDNGASDKVPLRMLPPDDVVPGIAGIPVLLGVGLIGRRRRR